MKRLDVRLTELGLAPTRSKAQALIRAGEVEVMVRGRWVTITDVSQPAAHARLVEGARTLKYVSRGGFKLEGALDHLELDVTNQRVLDVGLSTGGFADCLLKRGAAAVLGIDVGHGQLEASLAMNPRLTSIEGLNARELARDARVNAWLAPGVDLVVADLSFISLTLVIPALAAALPPGARAVLLVKPQFETEAARLNRRGVVEDPAVFTEVEARVTRAMTEGGFNVDHYFASVLKGQDGNQEFFVSGVRGP